MIERLLYTRYEAVLPWISGMFGDSWGRDKRFIKRGKRENNYDERKMGRTVP